MGKKRVRTAWSAKGAKAARPAGKRPTKPGPARPSPGDPAYERKKVSAGIREREQSNLSREIASECPAIADPARRKRGLDDLGFFCRNYFPDVFYLPFSADHVRIICKIETAVDNGGQFALAMPRASGKTAICAAAVLWAAFKGAHPFPLIVGATGNAAGEVLAGLKSQLETNDLLLSDFPEVCYPIRRLEGIAQRRLLWNGEPIKMKMTAKRIEFPSLPAGPAASCCIGAAGLTGRIRGMKFTRPDNREVRPSFVMLDDPQTDDSARSASQCAARENLIKGAVMGLAGPGQAITVVMPCTVVMKGDLADRFLDRKQNPDWKGERTKTLYKFPSNEAKWEEYWAERTRGLIEDESTERGNRFYLRNRAELDKGAEAAWPERFRKDEVSAIQSAMNIYLARPFAFAAEYQNEPIDDSPQDDKPSFRGIGEKVNGLARRLLPIWTSKLVAFVDVQGKCLYYKIVAFANDFTAAIVDYGAEPEENRPYWTLRDKRNTLDAAMKAAGKSGGVEAAIWLGLESLMRRLLPVAWRTEQGAELRVDRCVIDSGDETRTIYEFCRRSPFAAQLVPSKGVGIQAGKAPMDSYKRRPGEQWGLQAVLTTDPSVRAVRLLRFDTNFWKTFVARRMAAVARGSLAIFGKEPAVHRLLADHLEAETCDETSGHGRTLWEWKATPGRDNHWLDCLVGCYAAASLLGCRIEENRGEEAGRKKVSFAERQRERKTLAGRT